MNSIQKRKSMALVIAALIIQIGCLYASRTVRHPWELSLALHAGLLVGLLLLIAGLRSYAVAKGYRDIFGLLGFLSLFGVLALLVLPDKTKPIAAPRSLD